MSGIFKNFERLVSAQVFNKVNHGLIVKSPLLNYAPAHLYIVPGQQITRYGGQTPFQLSQIAYQLTRENIRHQDWLQQISADNDAVISELNQKVQSHQTTINDAVQVLALQLEAGIVAEQTIETLTNYVFVLAQQQNSSNAVQIVTQELIPQISQKLQYASLQNLSDLVQGLQKLGVQDSQVWEKVLEALQTKSAQKQETVSYHGWELDQYEYTESTCSQYVGSTEKYFKAYAEGTSGAATRYSRLLNCAIEQVWLRAINPVFFREQRPAYVPYSLDVSADRANLVSALNKLSSSYPQASRIATQINSL